MEAKDAGKDFAECLDAMNEAAKRDGNLPRTWLQRLDVQAALENVPEEFWMRELQAVTLL